MSTASDQDNPRSYHRRMLAEEDRRRWAAADARFQWWTDVALGLTLAGALFLVVCAVWHVVRPW